MNAPYDGDRGEGTSRPPAREPYPGPPEPGPPGHRPTAPHEPTTPAAPYPRRSHGHGEHPQGHTPRHPADGPRDDRTLPFVPPAGPVPYPQGTPRPASGRPAEPYPWPAAQRPASGTPADPEDPPAAPAPGAPHDGPYAGRRPHLPQGPEGVPYQGAAEPGPYAGAEPTDRAGDGTGRAGAGDRQQDAFAHLYRDQQHDGGPGGPSTAGPHPMPAPAPAAETAGAGGTAASPAPVAPPAAKTGGRASGLLKSSAVMAAGTMVSRLTGFVRTMVITAALGAGLLGDSFTVAYTLPTMIYILTVGGGLNSVFVPQLVRSMKEDEDGGEAFANRLLTLVMITLAAITAVVVLIAPVLIRIQSQEIAGDAAANSVAVTFARYCLPTIFFMGIHVVMGQILNARGKFGAMMWTPVLNNIVMIVTFGSFIWIYGTSAETHMGVETIPPEGVRLLGIGTLLGLTVQALAMIPYLREAGFRFRPRFDWRGHGLGKTVALAKWTVLFVLANQAGLIVVTQLSTAAGVASGRPGTGFLAYSNAQLIWAMPQAIITVSVMAALLPRISRAAADGDAGAVRDDISQGLRNSAVVIVPISFALVALGIPMCTLLFGPSSLPAAQNMGYMLMAFGVGLIPYSVQYVVLRGFYAYEDTRTPFYNTVIIAIANAAMSCLCYLLLPARWAVVGMAGAYGLAYAIGVWVAWRRLSQRLGGDLDGPRVLRSYARLCLASVPAALVGGALAYLVTKGLGQGVLGSIASLAAGGVGLLGVYVLAARRLRVRELNSVLGMVRGRLGR